MADPHAADLTVRTHELHDAAFKMAAIEQAYQCCTSSPAQARAYLRSMEQQLAEVRGQAKRLAAAIAERKGGK